MASPTSFRLTDVALSLLGTIAERDGVDKTATLEMLIRRYARELQIPIPNPPQQENPE